MTEFSDDCFPGSSHTQPIIRNGECTISVHTLDTRLIHSRVLLACIRFLGKCPCPTCLVEKKNIAAMGSKRDMKTRTKARTDDKHTQGIIARARSWIFEKGYNLRSAMVERLLYPLSLLPTRVSVSKTLPWRVPHICTEYVLRTLCTIRSQLLLHVCTRCAS